MSPEIDIIAGADVVHSTEGRVAAPQWPGVRDPAGVEEQGPLTGVLQEPGRPLRLLGKSRREHRVTNSRPAAGAPGGHGSEPRVRPGYRQAKATERGGTGDGESERPILPWTRGNRPEGPRRGKGAPGRETAGGTDARDTAPCYHLNTTTADSVAGPWPRGHGRIHGLKSRVPELGTPGSVGGRGG